jgi:hypothetical protein
LLDAPFEIGPGRSPAYLSTHLIPPCAPDFMYRRVPSVYRQTIFNGSKSAEMRAIACSSRNAHRTAKSRAVSPVRR